MRQNRIPIVLLMAGSLVAASLWRGSTTARVARLDPTATTQPNAEAVATQNFGQFNSYTLGLLLGGLRGPLVMTLWSSSESQKSERNLEDINTKIELIGLLQPEFDTVHLFQIWNKAYNLSVQMSNLAGKYATILDAIDYANKRRIERPQNINLESQLASVYFDKLGNSAEKTYYRERVRDESMAPMGQVQFTFPTNRRDDFVKLALAAGADSRRFSIRPLSGSEDLLVSRLRSDYADRMIAQFTGDRVTSTRIEPRTNKNSASVIRTSMDPVLDAQGKLLPSLASHETPDQKSDIDWRPQDGELAYLVRFEPYTYGVSPFAFAYNYYKRSVALQEGLKQHHAQLSERVISSRPALSLKHWSEEELERARLAEMAQFGLPPTPESKAPLPYELPASTLELSQVSDTPLVKEAIYGYERTASLIATALVEYREHLQRYRGEDATMYGSHMAHSMAIGELASGDALFLQAALAKGEDRKRIAQQAIEHYRRAVDLLSLNILAYYTPEEILRSAMPQGYGKIDAMNAFENPSAFPADQIMPTLGRVYQIGGSMPEFASISEIFEYRTYTARALQRMDTLRKAIGQ